MPALRLTFLSGSNDLKLFDGSSVLGMDEKQSLALSNCRLKKEDEPGLGADLGRQPDGRERQPPDPRTVRPEIQAFALHAGGTPKRKQGAERLSQLFSVAAGLCLRLGHVRPTLKFRDISRHQSTCVQTAKAWAKPEPR